MATTAQPKKGLKRSKSLKNLLSRARHAPTAEDEEILPCRPVKQAYAQHHVTTDDIHLRPTDGAPGIPRRSSSRQRNTWPQSDKERAAGSHNFDTVPHLVRTPWEAERRFSRRPQSQRMPLVDLRPLPRRIFEQLPREIYHCILDHLEAAHVVRSTVDVAGLQSSMKALLLTSKRWHRPAREHMYRTIWLPSNEELPKRTLSFRSSQTRLKMLLRTLGESDALSGMVRHIRVTASLACTLDGAAGLALDRRAAYAVVMDIINLCPNLESLSGYSPPVRDSLSTKLFVPLALRPGLKAHAWNIQAHQLGGSLVPEFDSIDLVECHDDWRQLDTLALCSSPDLDLGIGMVSAILQRLPSLKHLMLSRLHRRDFHNGTLMTLPALRSLRLDHLEGLTDHGLEQLAHTRTASSLENLSLVGLELTSLRTVQQLLAHLGRLRKFVLVQDTSPAMPPGMQASSASNNLGSPSLEYLHWDVLVAGTSTSLIANGIASGRFPSLRKVKVPGDYDGAVQALCRPIAQETMDAGDLELIDRFKSDRYERFLRLSQIQAQLRIRECRQQPSFNVVVHDPNKRISATHVIGSYLGDMESKIEYSLEPDVEGSHYALIDFGDVEAPKAVYERREECARTVRGEQLLDLSKKQKQASFKSGVSPIPTPFTKAPTSLDPFLEQLDPAQVYITHIDRHLVETKKQIFQIPVLLNGGIALLLAWRIYAAFPFYWAILLTLLGYPSSATVDTANTTRNEQVWILAKRTLVFLADFLAFRFVGVWPLGFFLEQPCNPVIWRWKIGFRADEIVVRVSRNWGAKDLMDGVKQGEENAFFKTRILPAIEKQLLRQKTGYLLMDKSWDLDFQLMLDAHTLVKQEKFEMKALDKLVLAHMDGVGWIAWQWETDYDVVEERRKKVVAFKEALTKAGKESLFWKWMDILENERDTDGGFTAEGQQRVADRVQVAFAKEGINFEELTKDVGGIEGLTVKKP
ncbi:hypothetical protein LTR22_024211 [Elasticomyces elasticus]|nr:hypothetical protein LTR22_024211 [Elasticomyces elasticus]KAK4914996.1 hypothetical protein LTR49_016861 [Elasticomyces elasticus]KAK5746048.1 hypothetical protein LTS12_022906 [Elasticomyces elasticus]